MNYHNRIHSLKTAPLASAVFAACAALYLPGAQALGLGETRTVSRIGEPLYVEVAVMSEPGESITARVVETDSSDGAPAISPSGTRVTVERRGENNVVVVRQSRSVTDPWVSLSLELSSSSGPRIIRRYDLLPDAPVNPLNPVAEAPSVELSYPPLTTSVIKAAAPVAPAPAATRPTRPAQTLASPEAAAPAKVAVRQPAQKPKPALREPVLPESYAMLEQRLADMTRQMIELQQRLKSAEESAERLKALSTAALAAPRAVESGSFKSIAMNTIPDAGAAQVGSAPDGADARHGVPISWMVAGLASGVAAFGGALLFMRRRRSKPELPPTIEDLIPDVVKKIRSARTEDLDFSAKS